MPNPAAWALARKGGIIPYRLLRNRSSMRLPACFNAGFPLKPAMSLTSSDISRIATLARLELDPTASERMLSQLNSFFDVVQQMRAVDTSGIEPLEHPFATIRDIALRLREDTVSESDNREANQRSAPAVESGLFLVPKVIE